MNFVFILVSAPLVSTPVWRGFLLAGALVITQPILQAMFAGSAWAQATAAQSTAAQSTAAQSTAAQSTVAQSTPSEGDDTRYSYNRVDDGYLRLDLRSGEVSLCNHRAVGWSCEVLPDDRRKLDDEIARLRSENAALKKVLLDRGLSLPASVSETPVAADKDPEPKSSKSAERSAEIERVKTLVGQMWRRLVEMIMNLQRDVLKKT